MITQDTGRGRSVSAEEHDDSDGVRDGIIVFTVIHFRNNIIHIEVIYSIYRDISDNLWNMMPISRD